MPPGGEVHEVEGYDALDELTMILTKFLGDKGYDSDKVATI